MKITVNSPSYKRPAEVKVLEYLPFCKIWVDESEAEDYRLNNPKAEIVSCPKGIQGNTARIRNYIIKTEIQNGADVVVLVDDDLHYIERFNTDENFGYVKTRLKTEDFMAFVEKYSIMAEDLGAKYWGIAPNPDPMVYRHFKPFNTICFVGGPFQCFLKGNRCWHDERLPLKEDYDMTLQQINKERVVLRVNYYHYYCEQSTNKGGCATYRNLIREKEQFELLQKKWGGDCENRPWGKERNEKGTS